MTRPALPYDYTCYADGTSVVSEILRLGYCIHGIIVHQTNISYSDEAPFVIHV